MIQSPPTKKTRAKRRKNHYFTKVHEDAIIRYAQTTCIKERTDLYINYIAPAFNEMVDKIVFTYKFTNLPNIDYLRDECKIWLMTILDKYDSTKGSKAFSYFSVITKNWFIHKVKRQQKRNKREVDFDNIAKHYEEEYLSTDDSYLKDREIDEFWKTFYTELNSWDESQMKDNDLKVYKAIFCLNQKMTSKFSTRKLFIFTCVRLPA